MNPAFGLLTGAVVSLSLALFTGCESGESTDDESMDQPQPGELSAPYGAAEDLDSARVLWSAMADYRSWPSYPGFDGWREGSSSHGRYVRYYINPRAAREADAPRHGAIIVQESYSVRGGPLMAISVMRKIDGYDPLNEDWFWVRFLADGQVMQDPMGARLAGRVGEGMPTGCIPCHAEAGGGDYLFVNDR